MRKNGLLFLLLALLCGFGAAGLVYAAMQQASPSVPVLVAAGDLAAGDLLTNDRVKIVKLPPAGLPGDALRPETDLSDLITAHGYNAGDILRRSGTFDLKAPGASILSARVRGLNDSNMRGMEIPVEAAAGMLGGMKAGDKVDVIAVYQDGDGKVLRSETVLQAAPVVGAQKPGEGPGALVVGVTPEQAQALALARQKGKLYVALRPFGY